MKTKSGRSAFFSLRASIVLIVCLAAASPVLLAFLRPEVPSRSSQRTLTFEQRVAYQKAIEEVYWHHRIWPKERPDPKPSLNAVMSQAQLQEKVANYLRNSQALEDSGHHPITSEQLQAEMDRMAQHTKQPEVLRELFAALGNNPFVIAECLARPVLTQRLVRELNNEDRVNLDENCMAKTIIAIPDRQSRNSGGHHNARRRLYASRNIKSLGYLHR